MNVRGTVWLALLWRGLSGLPLAGRSEALSGKQGQGWALSWWGRLYGGGLFPHPDTREGRPRRPPRTALLPPITECLHSRCYARYAQDCAASSAPTAHTAGHTSSGAGTLYSHAVAQTTDHDTYADAHHGHESSSASQYGDHFTRRA